MKMITNKTIIIAKREFFNVVKQKMFLIITFGIPLFFVFISSLSLLHTYFLATEVTGNINTIGIVDNANIIKKGEINNLIDPNMLKFNFLKEDKSTLKPIIKKFLKRVKVYSFTNYHDALEELQKNKIHVLYVIPEDYMESGEVRSYSKRAQLFSGGDYFLSWALRTALLKGLIDPKILNRVQDPVSLNHFVLNDKGELNKEDEMKFWGTLLIPYLASGIMMLTIFVPANYLLQNISEEKETRIIEILLSSVTTEELLTGKMIGLGAAGLIQAFIWLMFIAIPMSIGTVFFEVDLLNIVLYFMYILFGFLLYGSVMAGIGSLGYDTKQSAQLAGICSAISVLPLVFMPLIILQPNGLVARGMSYFPFTSSVTMMVRLATNKLDMIDVIITILILVPSIYFVIKAASKVFKIGLLMYGKRVSVKEVIKWLKSPS